MGFLGHQDGVQMYGGIQTYGGIKSMPPSVKVTCH